jgi:hypothetical protein
MYLHLLPRWRLQLYRRSSLLFVIVLSVLSCSLDLYVFIGHVWLGIALFTFFTSSQREMRAAAHCNAVPNTTECQGHVQTLSLSLIMRRVFISVPGSRIRLHCHNCRMSLAQFRYQTQISHWPEKIKEKNADVWIYVRCCISLPSLWSSGQRSGFDSRRYRILWEVVPLERGPLSLVNTVEELTEWYV